MSFLDKAKTALTQAKDKAADLADKNSDKIEQAIEKSGDFLDQKTKGKYADKIAKGKDAAEGALDKLDGKKDDFPETTAR